MLLLRTELTKCLLLNVFCKKILQNLDVAEFQFLKSKHQCGWHVNRKDVTKWRILEFSRNLFQCFFLKYKTETAKTVQRQLHILHNISSFRHFVISSHLFYWHANHIRVAGSTKMEPTKMEFLIHTGLRVLPIFSSHIQQ